MGLLDGTVIVTGGGTGIRRAVAGMPWPPPTP
jgi:hypothetical protein